MTTNKNSYQFMTHTKFKLTARGGLKKLIWPAAGLAALIWFLARVITKPSRAAYPCMQAAAPLASGFVVWLLALASTSALAVVRVRKIMRRPGGLLVGVCLLAAALTAIFLSFNPAGVAAKTTGTKEVFMPSDGPNTPVGVARGIFPGRVVWMHDPEAAHWSGADNTYWWEDSQTDPQAVSRMLSISLRALTGEQTGAGAGAAAGGYGRRAGRGHHPL